jgi:hypothetical protein
VPGQQRRGRDREDFRPAAARDEPGERSEPGPVSGSYRIRRALRRSTAFSCRSTSSSALFARSPLTTTTARLNSQRISRHAILSSTWQANHRRTAS